MTGRELIIYILENKLEDVEVLKDGIFVVGLMDVNETAAKFDVGVSTIMAWHKMKKLQGVTIGDAVFFFKDCLDPRLST